MKTEVTLQSIFKQRRPFILIIGFIVLLIMMMEIINGRFTMNDLQVYYFAAKAFVNDTTLYGQQFGGESTGFYKYSPFALIYFIPFSFLPLQAAKVVFFLLIATATITVFILAAQLLKNIFKSGKAYSNGMLFIVFGIACTHIHREFHMGNMNMILLLLLLLVLRFTLSGKQLNAGILFAIVLFIKPHFIILAPLFLLRKQYKLLTVASFGIIAEVLLPALFAGVSNNWMLHVEWIRTMQLHNGTLNEVYDTIYSLFLLIPKYLPIFGFQFQQKIVVLTLLTIVALAFGWFCLGNIKWEQNMLLGGEVGQSFWIEFLILVGLTPNLVNTDSEHFLLSIPLLFFLLGLIRRNTPLPFKISVVIAMLLYGMNIHDLLGQTISHWFTINGVLGFGNLLLIVLTCYGYRRFVLTNDQELNGKTLNRK